MAGAHEFRQHGFHARQVGHLLAHVLELVLGQAAGFLAMGAILQPQQLGDLIQAEAQPLGRSNELKTRQRLIVVMADASIGFVRGPVEEPTNLPSLLV